MTDSSLRIDPDLGDVIISLPDGSYIHYFRPADEGFFDDDGKVKMLTKQVVMESLGSPRSEDKEERTDDLGWGVYTIERVTYTSGRYTLQITEDDTYVGASAGTTQIVLALLTGAASTISLKIIEGVLQKRRKSSGGEATEPVSENEALQRVRNILYRDFGASGEVQFTKIDTGTKGREFVAVDSVGTEYHGSFKPSNDDGLIVRAYPKQRLPK